MSDKLNYIEAYDEKNDKNYKKILYSDCFLSYEEFKIIQNFNATIKDSEYIFSNKYYFNPLDESHFAKTDFTQFSHYITINEDFIQQYDFKNIPELQLRKEMMEKLFQKEVCEDLNIFLPDFHLIFDLEEDDVNDIKDDLEDKYPLIIKKSVDYEGINFKVLHDFNQLVDYIENIKKNVPPLFSDEIEENDFYIIESYIEGDEFIADFMIHPTQRNILVGYWKSKVNEQLEGKKMALEGFISKPNKEFPKEINENFKTLFNELNLTHGFAHCEYRICKKTNKVVLLDLNLRITGADIGKTYLTYYKDLFLQTIIDCVSNKPVEENIFSGFDKTYIIYKPRIENFYTSKNQENKNIGCVFINPKELIQREIEKAEIVSLYSPVGVNLNTYQSKVWINNFVYMAIFKTEMNLEDSEIYYDEIIKPTLKKYIIVDFSE